MLALAVPSRRCRTPCFRCHSGQPPPEIQTKPENIDACRSLATALEGVRAAFAGFASYTVTVTQPVDSAPFPRLLGQLIDR
jgi:hypothetical protein